MKNKIYLFILIITSTVFSEIYKNILPSDNLKTIRQKYPNATFEERYPAWAQKNDILYQISGAGISGKILIKFVNNKESLIKTSSKYSPELREYLINCKEECIAVEWVRWIPESKVPLKNIIGKYGRPDSTGYSDDDFSTFNYWKIGLTAYVNDSLNVDKIDYEFTYEDEIYDYKLKHKTKLVPLEEDNIIRFKYDKPLKKDSVSEMINQILFGNDSSNN